MNQKELVEFRNRLQGQLIRTYHHALALHKDQESIENLVRILDIHILNDENISHQKVD